MNNYISNLTHRIKKDTASLPKNNHSLQQNIQDSIAKITLLPANIIEDYLDTNIKYTYEQGIIQFNFNTYNIKDAINISKEHRIFKKFRDSNNYDWIIKINFTNKYFA